MTDQHVAEGLAAHAPVLYVDPPTSAAGAWRAGRRDQLAGPRLQRVGPSLARLIPVVPPGVGRVALRRVAEGALRWRMAQAVRILGGDVHAVVAVSHHPVFGACGERRRVYYATDDLVAGADLMGHSKRWVERCERLLHEGADTVATTSPDLAERWRRRGASVALVPNGVDHRTFAATDAVAPAADVGLPAPIVGFVGHLSERIDLALLEGIADRGVSLLLVGPRQASFAPGRLDELLARPNVQWVGPQPFQALPSYLRRVQVGVVPYADTDFNRASFPLKTLEYLAAGRPVVATDLPFVRWLATDLIDIASTQERFVAAVEARLREPLDERLAGTRRAFAAQHSWEGRSRELAALLGLA